MVNTCSQWSIQKFGSGVCISNLKLWDLSNTLASLGRDCTHVAAFHSLAESELQLCVAPSRRAQQPCRRTPPDSACHVFPLTDLMYRLAVINCIREHNRMPRSMSSSREAPYVWVVMDLPKQVVSEVPTQC